MFTRTTVAHVERLEARQLLTVTPLKPEVTVPFPTQMSQFDMAVAGDGSFIVVADPIEQPGSPDVVALRYDANGQQVGQPLTLDDRGFNVSVSMNADGDAVVAYQKGSDGVYVVRVSNAGAASAPRRVGFAPAGEVISGTAISADAGGGFFVAWHQRVRRGSGDSLQIRAFDAAGTPRGDQSHTGGAGFLGSFEGFDLAARPDGSGAVLAYEYTGEGFDYSSLTILDTNGIIGGAEQLDGVGPFGIDVAMHPDGSFVVGYERIHREIIDAITGAVTMFAGFAQRYDAAGQQVGGEIALGDSLPGNSSRDKRILSVTVDTLADGGFVAGFQQGSDQGITTYARRYDPAGNAMGGPVVVDTDPPKGHVIGADVSGRVVLAYLQGTFGEDPYNPLAGSGDVHVRRLEVAEFAELRGAELFVDGTDGNDHIIVERVRERLYVNVNGAVQRFNASAVQFLSISGLGGDDDIVNASAIPSTISGGDGADTLWGGTGSDLLRGFGGNDFLRSGDGSDLVFGGNGNDSLNGGDGDDALLGEAGEDSLDGASGADRLIGGRGSDALFGEAGNDTLDGGDADDYLEGGAGHDELTGGGGADALFGLAGNDRLFTAGDGFPDTVRGGVDVDTAEADELDDLLGIEAAA